MNQGSIVTFYSYKGGVGRTFAMANVAAQLSRWGYRILCIDWDLEAPGLHLYFRNWMSRPNPRGLTELVGDFVGGRFPSWRDFITPVRFQEQPGELHLMTAGLQDETYVQRMLSINWADLYANHDLGTFLEELREEWTEEFDFVLIDSRTGVTDVGGICTAQLPDFLVLLITPNDQSLYGAREVVESAKRTRGTMPLDRAKLLALPVPTRFETRLEYQTALTWLRNLGGVYTSIFADWIHRNVTPAELLDFVRVPYIPYWSFGERLPVIEAGTSNPEDIGFYFETLSAVVAHRYANTNELVNNRDLYVRRSLSLSAQVESARGPSLRDVRGRPANVFIGYSQEDRSLFITLKNHLSPLERNGEIVIMGDKMKPGWNWPEQTQAAIKHADIILLLVSPAFLASDFGNHEIKQAMERHYRRKSITIPVILKPVDWASSPLAELQALPIDGKPISTWSNLDEAFVEVVRGLKESAQRVRRR